MQHCKKVGLCIVHQNHNYGGMLQAYATILELDNIGIQYEIIDYKHPQTIAYYMSSLPSALNKVTLYSKLRLIRKRLGKVFHPDYANNLKIRSKAFDDFHEKNFINISKPLRDYEELKLYSREFTDVIVGSDQLWLPSGLGTNFYNLMFAEDKCNKIAYASSFGVSSIPNNQINRTKKYLSRIQSISVRESSGQKIVKNLTGRDVPVILDPTMIITKEQWDQNIPAKRLIDEDYIFCYFLGGNPVQREEVRKLSCSEKLKIVVLRHIDEYIKADEKFGDIFPYNIGPAEFVNLIRYAKYICTDSFHGSVFSIIYHKQFISFNRFKEGTNSRNSRLDTLFSNIGISRRFNNDIISEIKEPIDYSSIDSRIEILREKSQNYIITALGIVDTKENNIDETISGGHVICLNGDCTGCAACSESCPQSAITMIHDNCGFWRPYINNDLCIDCYKCNRVCPINKQPTVYRPAKAFIFQNSDSIRLNSTSGGFFNAVASAILKQGGVVCGAAFDDNMRLRHVLVESSDSLEPLQRSKYVQSSMVGVYSSIKNFLDVGKKVLFVGVGCQAAALRNYIGEDNNLVIIDLVCYGVPSSGLFEDWIKYLEKKYSKIKDIHFRDKSYGYATPNVRVIFVDGRYIESCRDSNMYTNLFFRHLSIRESCYSCNFRAVDRTSDITIGDYWSVHTIDPKLDDNLGTTVLFSHTVEGEKICRRYSKMEIDIDKVICIDSDKMIKGVSPAYNVNGFWKKYCSDGFESMMDMYEKKTIKNSVKYLVKGLMNKLGLSYSYYRRLKKKRLER